MRIENFFEEGTLKVLDSLSVNQPWACVIAKELYLEYASSEYGKEWLKYLPFNIRCDMIYDKCDCSERE